MPEIEFASLNISGYHDNPIANIFLRHTQPTPSLAVLFPGLNYTCDMPLLYFLTSLLTNHQMDVLQVRTDYTGTAFQSLSRQEQDNWFAADAQAAIQSVYPSLGYAKVLLVGKSIGTLALAHLVDSELLHTTAMLWLTPLLHNPWLVEQACQVQGPALFIGSRGDHSFDEKVMAYIQRKISCDTLILEGANHGLEYPGSWRKSLKALENILEYTESFLDKYALRGDQ